MVEFSTESVSFRSRGPVFLIFPPRGSDMILSPRHGSTERNASGFPRQNIQMRLHFLLFCWKSNRHFSRIVVP